MYVFCLLLVVRQKSLSICLYTIDESGCNLNTRDFKYTFDLLNKSKPLSLYL